MDDYKYIVNPINKLTNIAKKISSGEEVEIKIEKPEEFVQLASTFNKMTGDIKTITKERAKITSELNIAKQIQESSLPNIFPPFPERKEFEIYASMEPAKEVGGDFYDFFKVDENKLAFLIADVSGKGVPAALLMMSSRSMLKSVVLAGSSVEDTFNVVNDRLAFRNYLNMFVTVWMGVLDLRTGVVEFACAGHNPPAICRADGTVEFAKSKPGLVMAAMEGTRYKRQMLKLEPGDTIFLYTDGVTEATNANEELFGDDRLLQTLREACGMEPAEICPFVKSKIDEFVGDAPQFDDITMLALKYMGPTAGSPT